jgi:hypothetical protein
MKFLRTGGWEGGLCGRVLKVGGYGGPGVESGSLGRRRWRAGGYARREAEGVYGGEVCGAEVEGGRLCRAGVEGGNLKAE